MAGGRDPGAGAEVATFTVGGDRLVHGDRELTVAMPRHGILDGRPPYDLSEDARVLARFTPRPWGVEPIAVEVLDEDLARREPLLLLFAAFAAHLRAVEEGAADANMQEPV